MASWRTAGRTNAKDGGGCIFQFDSSDTTSADNGGTVRVDGAGHRLKAKAPDPVQLPAIFGMVANGTTDDKAALQSMLTWAYGQKIRDVYLPSGDIALGSSVFIPYGIMVHGQLSGTDPSRPGTRILTRPGASYLNGFMIGFNTHNNSTQDQNANYYGGGMENIQFSDENAALHTAKGILAFGNNLEFKNVGGRFMLQILKRADQPAYCDNFTIMNPYYTAPVDATVAQFEISGSGDGLIIEGGNFPPDQSLAISLVFYTQGSVFGGVIRQCINGSMYIDARNITIDNWHAENSNLKVGADAHVTLINSNIAQSTELTEPVIQMVDSVEGGNSNCLELDNVSFRLGLGQFNSVCPFDVSIGQQSRLVVRNSRRVVNGTYSLTTDTGIRVAQTDKTSAVPGWKSYADLLSRDGEIMPGYNVVLDHPIPAATGSYLGPFNGSSGAAEANAWEIAVGTYYYTAVRMYDVEKRIGRTGANSEFAVTVSNTTSLVTISGYCATRSPGAGPVQGMTRFYRGIASGSYNAYADVPLIAPHPAMVVDDGNYIGGVPWVSRTAGGIDTIYPPDLTVPWRVQGVGLLMNSAPVIIQPGNAAAVLGVGSDQQVTYSAALTAARSVTLPALGRKGDRVRVTRTATATGAFDVTIAYGSGSTATLAAPTTLAFADFEYSGTRWDLVAKSTI